MAKWAWGQVQVAPSEYGPCSLISHDPIVTSDLRSPLCVCRCPETRTPCIFCDCLVWELGLNITTEVLLVHERRHRSHLALCCSTNTPLALSSLLFEHFCSRSRLSPHQTARGPRKLVLGVARVCSCACPPPSPLSAPTESCTTNSVDPKDILHAELEPQGPR